MKILITSDLHLKLTDANGIIENGLNSRLKDNLSILDTMAKSTIDNHIDVVVIAGDIFDKINPSEKLRKLFVDHFVSPLIKNNIGLIILMGNHDTNLDTVSFESEISILNSAGYDGIVLIREVSVLEFNGKKAVFIPYGMESQIDEENKERISYIFGHAGIKDAITGVGVKKRDGEEINKNVFRNYIYSFQGHYHKPQIIKVGNCIIYYIGSTQVRDYGEREDIKRYLILDTETDKVESVILQDRKFIQVDIEEKTNTHYEDLLKKYEIKDNLVNLRFVGTEIWLKTQKFNEIKKLVESFGCHKVMITSKIIQDKNKIEISLEGNQNEQEIIVEYAKKKKLDEETIQFGLEVFLSND